MNRRELIKKTIFGTIAFITGGFATKAIANPKQSGDFRDFLMIDESTLAKVRKQLLGNHPIVTCNGDQIKIMIPTIKGKDFAIGTWSLDYDPDCNFIVFTLDAHHVDHRKIKNNEEELKPLYIGGTQYYIPKNQKAEFDGRFVCFPTPYEDDSI